MARADEAETLGLFAEEGARELAGDTGPIAGLATDAATVFDVLQGQQGFAHDFMRRFAFAGRDATDPARIPTNFIGIEKILGAHNLSAIDHGGEPRFRLRVARPA